jgi:hypothetical protein
MNTQGKSYGIKPTNSLIHLLPLILLYGMVFFSFFIHQQLPCDYQFLYPIVFLSIYIYFLYHTPKLLSRITIPTSTKPFLIFGFILINTVSLYNLSSNNRESEIRNYIKKNEHQLRSFISNHQNHIDLGISETATSLNICAFFPHQNNYYFKLYTFLGYGYGIIYTDSNTLTKPATSPGGSPIVKWIKIDEHWHYYSYFD